MLDKLKAMAWQLGTFAATGTAVVLTIMLLVSNGEKAFLLKEVARLNISINDPETGYVRKAAQCSTNVETLKVQVKKQTDAVKELSKTSAARILQADKDVAAANTANRKLDAQLTAAMKPLTGYDSCARVIEFDQRVLGSLK